MEINNNEYKEVNKTEYEKVKREKGKYGKTARIGFRYYVLESLNESLSDKIVKLEIGDIFHCIVYDGDLKKAIEILKGKLKDSWDYQAIERIINEVFGRKLIVE
jgi:hypothetical protein